MLRAFLEANPPVQPFSISTFGFGYSLDSQLLLLLAQIGGGGYGFIPDSGMVGTVFIHAVANTYATYAPRAHLDIEFPPDTETKVKGSLPVIKTSWGIQIDVGDIQFGQSREFVVLIPDSHANVSATLTYRPFNAAEDLRAQAIHTATPDLASIKYHTARLDFVSSLFAIPQTDNLLESAKALITLNDRLASTSILAKHDDAQALAKDVSGEGILALKADKFARWGKHYLPSLARAHQRQQSGNFKDPGLQVYGRNSVLFLAERDKLDAAFDALPPPRPSIPVYHNTAPYGGYAGASNHVKAKGGFGGLFSSMLGSGGSSAAPKLVSMKGYNSSAGPCFAGECLVKVPGVGAKVRIEQLTRGMEIESMVGPRTVAAVVRTAVPSGETLLCRIGDLKVTPWHPVAMEEEGKWVFPADVAVPEAMACNAIYSILLQPDAETPNAHTISVADVWCVTLGHGITSSASQDGRAHAFLGDYNKVLRDLSALEGFYGADGVVYCSGTRRSGVDRRICGFVGEGEVMESREFGSLQRIVECV
jgi:Hint-domain/VWA / Hh  protein intein-like